MWGVHKVDRFIGGEPSQGALGASQCELLLEFDGRMNRTEKML